eukprot:m.213222 g.213222  ORF g.213222 m.213222 type:complete len:292 (+) comp15082_c4_seq1:38-913(+)
MRVVSTLSRVVSRHTQGFMQRDMSRCSLGPLTSLTTRSQSTASFQTTTHDKRTYVLCHGAWYGGWCYRDVRRMLQARGDDVYTPTYTGMGEKYHLQEKVDSITLSTHIDDVVGVLETEDLANVCLVGHSYGGMVVTGVADRIPNRIETLVFLDAYTPSDGDSADAIRSAQSTNVVPLTVDNSIPGKPVIQPTTPDHHGLSGDLYAWANAHLKPQPLGTFTEPIELTGAWLSVPQKAFIRAADFPAFYFDEYYAHWSKDPEWHTTKHKVAHNHMMVDPAWLVGLLDAVYPPE